MRKDFKKKRIYILTKEVMASSPKEALKLDSVTEVDEVRLKPIEQLESMIGFDITAPPETDEESVWEDKKKKKK